MHISFTGTQKGLTLLQRKALANELLVNANVEVTHSGDCKGADDEFRKIAIEVYPHAKHEGHPCDIEYMRANGKFHIVHTSKPPLDRNRDMVDVSAMLYGCPKGKDEELRSGTWATIRYARKLNRPITLIFPDGEIKKENHK